MWLFFILYKSWVMIIFFSFQVGLNFFIKVCLFLRFKNALKKISNFFYCFLYFKLIFLMFLYFFYFVFKYIEIGSGYAIRPNENILNCVLPSRTHLSWVLSIERSKIALGLTTAGPISLGSCCEQDPSALGLAPNKTQCFQKTIFIQ